MMGYDNTLTIAASMNNLAQSDILRLSAPDSSHLGAPAMDAFDHDLNFEGNNLLYTYPVRYHATISEVRLTCLK
jgi:hypothetical protein